MNQSEGQILRKKKSNRRTNLLRMAIILIIATIIVLVVIYNYMNNILQTALLRSLNSFDIDLITYPSVQPNSVQLNITYRLENPTDFPITIDTIIFFSFSIDGKDIGGVSVPLNEELPASESAVGYFIPRPVTDEDLLNSLRKQTYTLTVDGAISGSASYLFVQTHTNKQFAFSKLMEGIPKAKS